jgi:hypothetical protein
MLNMGMMCRLQVRASWSQSFFLVGGSCPLCRLARALGPMTRSVTKGSFDARPVAANGYTGIGRDKKIMVEHVPPMLFRSPNGPWRTP